MDKRKKEGEEHSEENKWKEETLPGQEQEGKEIVQLIFQVWKQFQPLFIYLFILFTTWRKMNFSMLCLDTSQYLLK